MKYLYSLLLVYTLFSQELDRFPIEGHSFSSFKTFGDTLVVSTGKGIQYTKLSTFTSWKTLPYSASGFPVMMYKDSENGLWVSLATDSAITIEETKIAGKGILYKPSLNADWVYFPQPMDEKSGYDETKINVPVTTNITNISYALTETIYNNERRLWIASFAGSLRYIQIDSLENGWKLKTPNGHKLDVGRNDNIGYGQRAFALASDKHKLWVGTANGIFYSEDGGNNFVNITSKNSGLSGNFITLLAHNNGRVLANARFADGNDINALNEVSFNGFTSVSDLNWKQSFKNNWVYSLSFENEFTLIGTASDGLFIKKEGIDTYYQISEIKDSYTGERLSGTGVYASKLHINGDKYTFYVGTGEGLARSVDFGKTWVVLKAKSIQKNTEDKAIAYPSPYSPMHSSKKMRFSFPLKNTGKVTVRIFNYAMEELVSLQESFSHKGTASVVWDGKNRHGTYLTNGVYFFKVETPSSEFFNKFMVVN